MRISEETLMFLRFGMVLLSNIASLREGERNFFHSRLLNEDSSSPHIPISSSAHILLSSMKIPHFLIF